MAEPEAALVAPDDHTPGCDWPGDHVGACPERSLPPLPDPSIHPHWCKCTRVCGGDQ